MRKINVLAARGVLWLALASAVHTGLGVVAAETGTASPTPPARPNVTAAPITPVVRLRETALASANGVAPGATLQPIGSPSPGGVAPRPQVAQVPQALKFDSMEKVTYVTNGAADATFTFAVTNVSDADVTISSVHTSCGCTAAKLPQQPWVLHPGDHGEVGATMHVAGKWGTVIKTVTIVSSQGSYPLTVCSVLPEAAAVANQRMSDRSKNLQVAAADRQAVFRGDCATCHVQPTVGKMGKDLYIAACGICHEAEHRASMVPVLSGRTGSFPESYWNQWVRSGKVGSLMPAFELKQGGPLNEEQIQSLTAYLANEFLLQPLSKPGALAPAATPALNPAPLK